MNTEQSDKIVYPKLLGLIPFYRCFFVEIIQLHPNNLGTGQKKRSLNVTYRGKYWTRTSDPLLVRQVL